jgi:transcriptional regulator with XRE-family HTH domain
MSSTQKWADDRFGKRVKAERETRGWSQAEMAKILSDRGLRPMHPTTVAKIEAGDRSVRINEAVGIADLFKVSMDDLLGRKQGTERNELTYPLRVLRDTARRSAEQVGAMAESIREQLAELPGEFDGADVLQRAGLDVWGSDLPEAMSGLMRVEGLATKLLQREHGDPEGPDEAPIQIELPENDATKP